MSEHSINHIGDMVKKILETLGKFFNQVMEALNHLKKLPDYVAQLREDMNQGFDRLIQAQGEMEIYGRMAHLKSKKELIRSENEAIKEFEEQLNEDFVVIDKRYSKINSELEEECAKRIRELDMHLFEIPSRFPREYITAFNEKILPLFEKLINDSNISYSQRVMALEIAVEKSKAMINRFVSIRNSFFEKVSEYEIPLEVEKEKELFLPMWIVEVENTADKKRKSYLIPPSRMQPTLTDSFKDLSVTFLTDDPFIELDEPSRNQENSKQVEKYFKWKNDPQVNKHLEEELNEYFNASLKGNYSQARGQFLKAIRKSTIQTIN